MKKLYGLLGEKIGHSFSTKIHSMILESLKLEGYYHLFQVDKKNIQDAILGFKALNVKGINVTIPYKIEVIKYLDSISKESKSIGAINTICFNQGKTIGYNTDYYGFAMTLNKFKIDIEGRDIVILGTGGASKAVVKYLIDNKAGNITFVSRNPRGHKNLVYNFKEISYDEVTNLSNTDILINCTPCGMYPNIDECPLTKQDVLKFKIVIDLIYNPQETLLLEYARKNDIKAINGLYMLVSQAIKSQELWNSVKIKKETVDKVYRNISNMFLNME